MEVPEITPKLYKKQKWEITRLQKDSYRDGDATNFFNRTTGSVAFDQGNSIPLSDGKVLWITQDAWYEGSLATNGRFHGNHTISHSFGSRGDPNSFGYETFLHVARFSQNNPQGWTFWNGTSWSAIASTAEAAKINKGLGTNSVGYLNGKYIHLTMDQGFYCGIPSINMYISTSTSPTGPFTSKKLVFNFTEFYKGSNARIYTPSLHTESLNDKNELLITYSINYGAYVDGNNDGAIRESDGNLDPYYYRVKGSCSIRNVWFILKNKSLYYQ